MGLRKHISYQWRFLLPMVSLLWLVVIVLGIYMLRHERELKFDTISAQVALINKRIINAYGDDVNMDAFLRFVETNYREDPTFDGIRISVYHAGNLIYSVGEVIPPEASEAAVAINKNLEVETEEARENNNLYYEKTVSPDKNLTVMTLLPYTPKVMEASSASVSLMILLIGVAVAASILAFLLARRIGHNLKLLSSFATQAAINPNFVPTYEYSHDELGDIARQIVRFHTERISSLNKLKREHNVAMHALDEKARIKRDLTNNINHELKTPVGVIKGYVDTIIQNPDMDENSRNMFMRKVNEHVDRLTRLLEDLSSITRLEFGSQMVTTEPIDFHEVVFQAVNDLETSGVMGKMVFNYDIPTYCRVIGNEGLLEAVIGNFAKNSVAYSKGTECNLILIDKDEEFFHFAFYDNGVGVKESSLPHLFERFFREDTGRSRKKGGTGLGLCIVQSTIEALGGTITASNREGGGLLFRFTLRRADKQA